MSSRHSKVARAVKSSTKLQSKKYDRSLSQVPGSETPKSHTHLKPGNGLASRLDNELESLRIRNAFNIHHALKIQQVFSEVFKDCRPDRLITTEKHSPSTRGNITASSQLPRSALSNSKVAELILQRASGNSVARAPSAPSISDVILKASIPNGSSSPVARIPQLRATCEIPPTPQLAVPVKEATASAPSNAVKPPVDDAPTFKAMPNDKAPVVIRSLSKQNSTTPSSGHAQAKVTASRPTKTRAVQTPTATPRPATASELPDIKWKLSGNDDLAAVSSKISSSVENFPSGTAHQTACEFRRDFSPAKQSPAAQASDSKRDAVKPKARTRRTRKARGQSPS